MECKSKMLVLFLLLITLHLHSVHSKSIIDTLPGFSGQLPFTLETGYIGIGENEEIQLFYYFVESENNPEADPLVFYYTCFYQIGPLTMNFGNGFEETTLTTNPNSWTKTANIIFVDMPAGTGFSYGTTKEAWISSDSIVASQATEFLRKFLVDHPQFLKNPLYMAGISYMGIVTPIVTLNLYTANERGDQPILNIQVQTIDSVSNFETFSQTSQSKPFFLIERGSQGYILCSPLTDKFTDFNSRIEYAHRMTLISDDIYQSAIENCHGNYVNMDKASALCSDSIQRYNDCTSRIDFRNILDPVCDDFDIKPYCGNYNYSFIEDWANDKGVQQALKVREGTIGKWELINNTLHYIEGKNDTSCYSYDIFSCFSYHKKLVDKKCRALIFIGDHDMTFPHVGVERWINDLNLEIDSSWEPYFVDNQVGGYETTYAKKSFSMTYATVKGAGHTVALYKPKEAMMIVEKWLAPKYTKTVK